MERVSEAQEIYLRSVKNQPIFFLARVEDVKTIPEVGTIVKGTVTLGFLSVNELVEVIAKDGSRFILKVMEVTRDNEILDLAKQGDQIEILFDIYHADVICVGDVVLKSNELLSDVLASLNS